MMQLSRREFLVTPCALAVPMVWPAEAQTHNHDTAYYRVASEQACRGAGAAREVTVLFPLLRTRGLGSAPGRCARRTS